MTALQSSYDNIVSAIMNAALKEGYNHIDDYCKICNSLNANGIDCDSDYGCSKFVIILRDEDYVIKMPFYGYIEDGKKDYEPFLNAKYSDNSGNWNYCEKEAFLYEMAIEEGIEDMFAETRYIPELSSEYPVYFSKKVTPYYSYNCSSELKKDVSAMMNLLAKNNFSVNSLSGTASLTFLAIMLNYYGEEKFLQFFEFCVEWGIGDIRLDNVGFDGGRPVLLDYSGFDD